MTATYLAINEPKIGTVVRIVYNNDDKIIAERMRNGDWRWSGSGATGNWAFLICNAVSITILVPLDKKEHQANLGLATTQQLLDEVTSRIQMDYYIGGGGLGYTTVGGRSEVAHDLVAYEQQ
jgi:hypothetical protein